MPRIRIEHPTYLHTELLPGDEIDVQQITPAIEALIAARRLDGEAVARLVADDETADLDRRGLESAAVRHGRAGKRPQTAA